MLFKGLSGLIPNSLFMHLANNVEPLDFALWGLSVNDRNHLVIGGCDCIELIDKYGTPLHVVDMVRLKDNYLLFVDNFCKYYPQTEVFCSYKTNPVPRVLESLHNLGANAEVISHFELWLALRLGLAPGRIIFNGPGKTIESIELAVSEGIRLINIDGPREVEIIDELAQRFCRIQRVGVRVVSSVGWGAQFGFSIRSGAALEVFEKTKQFKNIKPCALHLHLGTGIKDISTYLKAIKEALEFAVTVRDKFDIHMNYFDFGGGFGVPTVKHFTSLDNRSEMLGLPPQPPDPGSFPSHNEYARSIMKLFSEYYPLDDAHRPIVIFEPGRAITSSAQILLTQVLELKTVDSRPTNVIIDAGKNLCIPTSWEYHEVFVASRMVSDKKEIYRIYGPLCHPNDVVFGARRVSQLTRGDALAIMDAGAYFIPNQRNFSFPRPPVVAVEDGKHWVLREKEKFEDIVKLDDL